MNDLSIKTYAFVLGREAELCLAELKATLSRLGFAYNIINVAKNTVFINIDNTDVSRVAELTNVLGGTIKIFEIINKRSNILERDIYNVIVGCSSDMDRVEFGISLYDSRLNPKLINSFGLNIKKKLKSSKSVRFVALSDGTEISSIVSLKQGLLRKGLEIGVFSNSIGKLVGLSNAEEWNTRDYEKPRGDKRSGMLPPKLARIMINLALGGVNTDKEKVLLIDPFCGSGNVLLESMMLGIDFLGTDVSVKAVDDSTLNCEWLQEKNSIANIHYKVGMADATEFDFLKCINDECNFKNKNLFSIVCEPYLGEPKKFKPTLNATKGEYRKVKDLYIGFLQNFSGFKGFRTDAQITFCVVFPFVETLDKGLYSLYRECVDEIKKMGYTELQSPLVYGRDYQVVKREIALLTLGRNGSL